jgi:hypothetical protein
MRFRWLDPNRALERALTDVTTPLTEFVALAPTCRNIIVTENKVNFLTLPESLGTLAIFGGGYALGLLTKVPWLDAQPLYYWVTLTLTASQFWIVSKHAGQRQNPC